MRVSAATRDRFARLADSTGRPMTQLLDEAVDALERRLFFEQLTARYDELRDNAAQWREISDERVRESGVLADELR